MMEGAGEFWGGGAGQTLNSQLAGQIASWLDSRLARRLSRHLVRLPADWPESNQLASFLGGRLGIWPGCAAGYLAGQQSSWLGSYPDLCG